MFKFKSSIPEPKSQREKDLLKLSVLVKKAVDYRNKPEKRAKIRKEVNRLTKKWGFTPLEVEEEQAKSRRYRRNYRKDVIY